MKAHNVVPWGDGWVLYLDSERRSLNRLLWPAGGTLTTTGSTVRVDEAQEVLYQVCALQRQGSRCRLHSSFQTPTRPPNHPSIHPDCRASVSHTPCTVL